MTTLEACIWPFVLVELTNAINFYQGTQGLVEGPGSEESGGDSAH